MQLRGAECFILRWPEPNDFGHERMTLLLRIDSAAGISGWGEAIAMWPEAIQATKILIEQGFLPLLQERDILDVEGCWQAMKAHSWWYGEGGIASIAISAIDMALWDLKAKDAGKPLVDLLGRAHKSLPACASLHVNQATIAESVSDIAGHIEAGFRSTKLGLGKRGLSRAGRDPDYDVELVGALRAAIGPDAGIMVDAGNGTKWDVETAIRTVRRMEEHDIAWIEEPFNPIEIEAHKALKAATATPLAVGEREYTLAGYQRWLDTGIVDIFGLDPARIDGVTGFRRAQAAIEAAGRTVNAHAWSTAVLTGASLHLSLAAPSAELFELKPLPGPMQFDLIDEPFWHEDGRIHAPNRPGHGAEPRESVLAQYRVS
jgi:D-galactarolactone cycloisomerase